MHVLNFAHRGFSGKYPENTMLAFERAVQTIGCEGIENDIQLTKDHIPVIIHDEWIDRTCKDQKTGRVKDFTLAELQEMDFSYHFDCGREAIPTLEAFLDFMRGNDLILNLELKTGVFEYRGIEEAVWKLLLQYDMTDRVIISSFNHYSVLRMKQIAPDIRCGLLSDAWLIDAGSYVRAADCEYYHPNFHNLTEELTGKILEKAGINTWTVNEEADIRRMISLGVTAVIGNDPELVSKVRASMESE